MSKTLALIFPHQLFQQHPVILENPQKILLVEHPLFFGDQRYPLKFHKQKLAYHRATMLHYVEALDREGFDIELLAHKAGSDPLAEAVSRFAANSFDKVIVAEVHDDILSRRVAAIVADCGLSLGVLSTPGFINSMQENMEWRSSRKRWFMADFYQWQRRRLSLLMEGDEPEGGRWSFDEDNRRKLAKKLVSTIPALPSVRTDAIVKQAIASVETEFPDNPGTLTEWHYPVTAASASAWLDVFLAERLHDFGTYEDAIVPDENFIFHSVLTPMLNVGLLTPQQVIDTTINYAAHNEIPLNSLEGFIRQVIGWREFMRATYEDIGSTMRCGNHWHHHRKMPECFYTATTGITPVDNAIERVLSTGYCHHIERLMVLGGFMFLCEIDPDDVYRWFMEMFIDSYDWVMVPNVYAMSQHADGGSITTKPYFSGSNYVIKMSHYKKGEWSDIWDALFWRWIFKHSQSLKGNPRWAMMVKNAERMDNRKRENHVQIAEAYLATLDAAS